MFPWNYGFHWSAGTVAFLGAFYAVLTAVLTTIVCALGRSRRAWTTQRIEEIRWRSDFHSLPPADRTCRHAWTGELPGRECPNAFECRHCETHAGLLALAPPRAPADDEAELFGLSFPLDRLYHRGHTWVHPEADGTVTIGLDDLATRLVGIPDAVELPPPGTRLRVNGPAWSLRKRNARIRALSPVDGEVVETGGSDLPWYLRVKPADGADFRHLLGPSDLKPWLLREVERIQLALSPEGAPALADGGVPVTDIAAHCTHHDWEAICGTLFLQP